MQNPASRRHPMTNNVIVPIGGDDNYKQHLSRKPTYLPAPQYETDPRVAGVKYRPKTGERSMDDVFHNGAG